MSDGSSIEWLNWPGYRPATWNPARGCTRKSRGCENCYAEVMAARFSKPGQWGHGIAEMRAGDHRWTGLVELDEAKLLLPLRWRQPRCIFVNSTSDLFHERLPDEAIDRVFAVMALCPQHRFICLTKRAERMRQYIAADRMGFVEVCSKRILRERSGDPSRPVLVGKTLAGTWPWPHVILGVSVEDQATAGERIPHLLATPAACRMVSAEPLLEDLGQIDLAGISWCVVGGESGTGARPMHPDWARSIRDKCSIAGVAYFHKQNGEFAVVYDRDREDPHCRRCDSVMRETPRGRWLNLAGGHGFHGERVLRVVPVGKHRAGRLLDGREWTEFPFIRTDGDKR